MTTNRPQAARMPAAEFLKELGDARIDEKTLAELDDLRAKGEDADDLPTSEQSAIDFPEGLPETQTDETQAPEEQETQPTKEPTDVEVLKAQLEAEREAYKQILESVVQKYTVKPAEPEPQFMQFSEQMLQQMEAQDPFQAGYIRLLQQNHKMMQRQEALESMFVSREQNNAAQQFEAAIAEFKANPIHTDFDKHVPPELMAKARAKTIQNQISPAEVKAWVNMVYWGSAGPSRVAKPDEVSQKRDQKRQEQIKQTRSASGGGGTFQKPSAGTKDNSLRAGRNEMLADIKAMGGI